MNEKIKQLAEQAGINYVTGMGYSHDKVSDLQLKDFAELVVLECYEVCKNNLTEYDSDEAFKYNEGVADCAILIKRQFGVK